MVRGVQLPWDGGGHGGSRKENCLDFNGFEWRLDSGELRDWPGVHDKGSLDGSQAVVEGCCIGKVCNLKLSWLN